MENKKWYEDSLFLNRDPDWCLGIDCSTKELAEKNLDAMFSLYASEAVTDVALQVFAQASYIPNTVFDWMPGYWIKYKDTDPQFAKRWENFYRCYVEYKLDPVQIFIDRTTKNGRRAWVSIRMNDCHKGLMRSKFFDEEHAEGHLIGEAYDYYWHAYDFQYPRYRTLLKYYIAEVLSNYDFFGIEYDFLREAWCFDYNNVKNPHEIMTEYLRELKAVVTEAEKRVGHKIQILMRVPRDIKTCMDFGFDIETIAKEGLADVFSPCARWGPNESCIPVREWIECVGDNAVIIPGIEVLNKRLFFSEPHHNKAYLAAFHGQGAPGTYLYNFWYIGKGNSEDFHSREEWKFNKEECSGGLRDFIVTEQDLCLNPETKYKPFPFVIDGEAEIPLEVGRIKPSDPSKIIVDFLGDVPPALSINGSEPIPPVECEPVNVINHMGKLITQTDNTPLCYDITGTDTESLINLKFIGQGTLFFIDVIIDAK